MADKNHMQHADVTCDPKAEERLEHTFPVKVKTPPDEERGMLPGVAMICMYLLLLAMLNAYAAATGKFQAGWTVRYSVLTGCTLLVVGVFGLLRLRRWGWSLVVSACIVLAGGYLFAFERTHIAPYIVQGLFSLVFFLYLSRTEVRQRLR